MHHYPVRIFFEDTDAGGIVYHANYLRYMERARSDMLRLIGIDQRGALDGGEGVYAVTRLAIDYRLPAKLDDDLIVTSRVAQISGATVTMTQDMARGADLLTRAEVRVAFLSPQGRPKRQPKPWVALFTRIAQGEDIHP
ncbi:tol-pal system-associated acyl-CoA thioesterase [Sphingobium jiangsuense]|nr:tol-pal system-associated acyl-CoA thioesterase [Sphingobium jiangsuense]